MQRSPDYIISMAPKQIPLTKKTKNKLVNAGLRNSISAHRYVESLKPLTTKYASGSRISNWRCEIGIVKVLHELNPMTIKKKSNGNVK
jgi:hypothetical protein